MLWWHCGLLSRHAYGDNADFLVWYWYLGSCASTEWWILFLSWPYHCSKPGNLLLRWRRCHLYIHQLKDYRGGRFCINVWTRKKLFLQVLLIWVLFYSILNGYEIHCTKICKYLLISNDIIKVWNILKAL